MANLKAVSVFIALVTTCIAVKPPGFVEKPAAYDESPPRYSFEYEVRDPEGGAQGHAEVRRGLYAVGGYYTRLPGENGAQRVSYYADDWGFHPVLVAYGGHGYNTRLAFGDKAVATANAAAGTGGAPAGGPTINAIGVHFPAGVNPLPDLTQTGAAALAAEAPEVPDAATLVSSVGQPPAPPQPPRPAPAVGPAGTTFLPRGPQFAKPIQTFTQQIGQIQPQRQFLQPQQQFLQPQQQFLQPQQQFLQPQRQFLQPPQGFRLPLPVAKAAKVRPILPVAPIIPTASYPRVQPYTPIGLGLAGISGPTPTAFVSTTVPVRRPAIVTQPSAPVFVSTTPAPVAVIGHPVEHGNGEGSLVHPVSAPATSFVSSGHQTVAEAPTIVPQFQPINSGTTVITGGVDSFKESSAAAAAAAASALSAAALSGSGRLQEANLSGQGEVYYSQQTNHGGNLANTLSSGSFLASTGHLQQANAGELVGVGGQTEYTQGGGYHYERPASGGLTYAPLASGPFNKGQVGGVVGQGFQFGPTLSSGYQSGFVYSPGYTTVYPTGAQIAFGGGTTTSSSFSQSSSVTQASSAFNNEGTGLGLFNNKFVGSGPQGATTFQSHIDHTQFQQPYPSLPPPTANEGIGLGLGNIGFVQQQTLSTPTPQVTVTEEFNVTPRPDRPIVVPDLPKITPTTTTVVESSTPAPPQPSPTLNPEISSSTIASPVPSSFEVTTPTPFTSSTPITPFYSTFPSNAPCYACQSTRSQEITLLTAPASDTATTLDSELQQIFFPDPTPSLQIDSKEATISSTPRPVDVTPKPFSLDERIGSITTNPPTVSVQVLEEEENRASTVAAFSGSNAAGEEIYSTERGSNGQFFSEGAVGNAQFYGGDNEQLFTGNANVFSGSSGSGAQFLSKSNGESVTTLSGERVGGGQIYSGQSGLSEQVYRGASGGGSEYYNGGQIYTVTSTPTPPITVSLGVTPSPSVLYVDRPVAVPVPYAVPQLVPYAVKGSSASSYKDRNNHRLSGSSSSSSSESYESSTPSVISVTQITKIRTSGRKNADRGYVKQVVEESGSSSLEEEEEEEVIVRGGSVKLGSGRFGSDESYSGARLPPPPFRSSSTQSAGGNYGERLRIGRPRKLCIEYGGFKPPLIPSDPDYSQSIHLR